MQNKTKQNKTYTLSAGRRNKTMKMNSRTARNFAEDDQSGLEKNLRY